jgi:hypothetical protein
MTDTLVDRTHAIRQVESAIGRKLVLRAIDTIVSTRLTDTMVAITVRVPTVVETRRETRYVGAVLRMMVWTRTDGDWSYMKMEVKDDEFVPYVDNMMGRIESPAEYNARRNWEAMQYRVGNDLSPMDNAERSADPTYSPMHDYWMKG